jgi:glucokinase
MSLRACNHLAGNQSYVVGIDIGKTKIAVGIISSNGIVMEQCQQPTNMEEGGHAILEQCFDMTHELIDNTSLHPEAIGIGSSGIVDHDAGMIVSSGTIPNWQNIPICSLFTTEFDLPTTVDNDVYAAALGEYHFGAARSTQTTVYMVISTGIGVAILENGKIRRGCHGLAGQIAYLPLPYLDMTVSDRFSGKGITQQADRRLQIAYSPEEVFRKAAIDDDFEEDVIKAKAIVNEAVDGAAFCLAWLQQVLDPDRFVLSGGIALGEEEFFHRVHKRTDVFLKQYMPCIGNSLNIALADLGKNSGIIGAATLAFEYHKLPMYA